MPAVSGGYFGAGRRPQRTQRRPDVNPRTNPLAAGPPAPIPQPRGRTVFTQPLAQQPFHQQQRQAARHVARAILNVQGKAPSRPLLDSEVRGVLRSPGGQAILRSAAQITQQPEHQHHRSFLSKALSFVFNPGGNFTTQATAPSYGNTRFLKTAGEAAIQTGRAFTEDPLGVSAKTAKGLGELGVGAIAAIPDLGVRTAVGTVHGHPLQGVDSLIHAAAKDVSRRYGPLYRGVPGAAKQFRTRIKKEGAASELVDAATIAVPEGAIAGRTLGAAARAGRLGDRLGRVATEARPALRVSGDTARPQELSRNLFRAAGQRAEDVARQRAAARRAGRPQTRGLQPRPGEVVKLTRRGQDRAQRIEASHIAAQTYEGFKNELGQELDHGARKELSKLSKKQQRAVYPVVQGLVDAGSPERAVRQLHARNAQIRAERALHDAERQSQGLEPRAYSNDPHQNEVLLNEYLIRHANDIFGPKLKAFQQSEAARSIRAAAEQQNAHPAFKSSTAEVRRLRVQGHALGVEHPYDVQRAQIEAHNPIIHPNEVGAFTQHSAVKEPLYSVRSAETARKVQSTGLDPSAARKGVFGAGTYMAAGKADRSFGGTAAIAAHADIRHPLVIPNDRAMEAMKTFREAAQQKTGEMSGEAVAQEITRQVKHAGYDGVIIKGAGPEGQDWVVAFDRHQVRVVAPKTAVRTGAIDRATAKRIAEEHGVRLTAHQAGDLATTVELQGPRDAAHAAAARIAEHSGSPARVFHELDGGSGRAIFVDGKLHSITHDLTAEQAHALGARFGRKLEVRHGDVQDIGNAGEPGGVRPNPGELRGEGAAGASGGVAPDHLAAAEHARAQALAELERRKPQLDAQYAAEVRRRARAAGLPEPGYIAHHPRGDYPFSDFAPGGARAVQGVRQSQLKLHALGIADTRPGRYVQSLARTIKLKHNWPGVAKQAEAHSFNPHEFGSQQELANILGRPAHQVDVNHLSIEDWRRILHAKGLDARDYAFWNPGRLRQARDVIDEHGHPLEHMDPGIDGEASPAVFEGWQQAAADMKKLREAGADSVYLRTRGWKLLPKEAYDEITAGTRPSGAVERMVQKVQGFQSRVLLGTNPSWLQMQVAANAILTGFGMAVKGAHPGDLVAAQRWYHGLAPEEKKVVDEALSTGVFESHGGYTHLGASTDSQIVAWVRAIGELPAFQKLKRANPVTLLFHGDHAQNAFFRRTLLYSSLKRQALRDLGHGIAGAYQTERKIAGILSIKDPQARMREILTNQDLFRQHAEFVDRILGNYSRFTARERRTFKRYTLFYGFMRYALKTMFYTLPVKHPLATAITAKLAQLHNSEVRDLLGGDQAPWAFSRIFFEGKGGKLRSIDLGRVNPVSSPVLGLVTEGPSALAGLFSPLAQEIADQIYGKQLYSGLGYRVHGNAEENPSPDLITRGRIALNHMLATSFPLRELAKATEGNATQGDDSLPFSPRPLHYKSAAAQGRERTREAAKGPVGDQILRDLFPLAFTKPDTTRDTIAAQERRNRQPITVPGQRSTKAAAPQGLGWANVKIPAGAGSVDWSKVRIP